MKAPPVVLGALFGFVLAAALTPAATAALQSLRAARVERATLAQLAAGPAPSRAIVADGLAIVAPDAGTAADRLAARLRALAAKNGLLVEQVAAAGSVGLARVRLRVSGSEDAVIAFADTVERGRPTVRLTSWSMLPRNGRLTLTATAVSPWQ